MVQFNGGKEGSGQRAVWRVGDGKDIQVWQDKWLKKPPKFKAQRLDHHTPTPLRVDSLINVENREWNMVLVREVMMASDTAIVERIPLSRKRRPDMMI